MSPSTLCARVVIGYPCSDRFHDSRNSRVSERFAQRGVFHMPQPQQLPGPNADIWDWQMHGLCRGVDSSVFFHPDGERGRARAQREMRAKEMCRSCPVMAQCRAHALDVGEPYGIWGGLSETERELLLQRDISRTRGIRRSA